MPKTKFNIPQLIAGLCRFGVDTLGLNSVDAMFAQNALLHLFKQTEADSFVPFKDFNLDVLNPLVDFAVENKLCNDNDAERINFEARLLGFVTPPPSQVIANFDNMAAFAGIEDATGWLYKLSQDSQYIRVNDVAKNIKWTAPGTMGDLTVTINLSKPEKDNKEVARLKALPPSSHPKCVICPENIGYAGNEAKAARQTLRLIPLHLNNEQWYFQYSPYVYYDNHCIVVSENHTPMQISPQTITRLFDFVELFPHYFLGSNADLPIVGGSILSHDHFQGGKKVMPMMFSDIRKSFVSKRFGDVEASILNWYNSVIKLQSHNRLAVESLARDIIFGWKSYTSEAHNIVCKTSDVPHNTVTPVACLENGLYTLYIVLRNNRTNDQHPDGIFHPSADMHNIKKEGIGIIEVMGIFILPGRLFNETKQIVDILLGKTSLNFAELSQETHPLNKHLPLIAQLANDHGVNLPEEKAEKAVVDFINATCIKILNCTAVFKNTEQGQEGFAEFLKTVGFEEKN
jgi:UDPglucose--hexose-1-phosphate uridylyltransferase